MYRTGVGIETEKVADNITQFFIDSYEGSSFIYFTSPTGEKLNLYDYVIDKYAEDDNFVVKPDKDDFLFQIIYICPYRIPVQRVLFLNYILLLQRI